MAGGIPGNNGVKKMKRPRVIYNACALVAVALAVSAGCSGRGGASSAPATERFFEFTYRAEVSNIPDGAGKVDLWLPYPESDESQTISAIKVESDFPARVGYEGKYGNAILHVGVRDPDVESLAVTVRFKVKRKEVKSFQNRRAGGEKYAAAPDQRYLAADRLVIMNDEIRKLSRKITVGKTSDVEKARAIYDYVARFMRYDKSGTGWGNGDTKFCLVEARGNCTDYHSLFLSLARSAGIPAKFEIGFPLPEERGAGEVAGYHCWAEFFARGYGWVAIDNSEADKHTERHDYYFGGLDENRVLMSVGRDIALVPDQKGPRINYFIYPYAEVDGRPFKKVTAQFSYRDLDAAANQQTARLP